MKKIMSAILAASVAGYVFGLPVSWTGNEGDGLWETANNWAKETTDVGTIAQAPYAGDVVTIDIENTIIRSTWVVLFPSLTLADGVIINTTGELQSQNFGTVEKPIYPTITGGTVEGKIFALGQGGSNAPLVSDGCNLIITSSDFGGMWRNSDTECYVDMVTTSGRKGSLTYPTSITSSPYSHWFGGENPRVKLDGANLSETEFEDNFAVTVNGDKTTITLLESIAEWKVGTISADDVTSSSATLSATLAKVGEGEFSVYVACSKDTITADNILTIGESVEGVEGVYTKAFTSLDENTIYNYAFAIVVDNAVASFKSATFVASTYEYIYLNGAWVDGKAPANLAADNSIFIGSDYSPWGDFLIKDKYLQRAKLTVETIHMTFTGEMTLCNGQFVAGKWPQAEPHVAYGIYGNADNASIVFKSESGNGTIYPASSFSFVCYSEGEESCDDIYSKLFATGRLKYFDGTDSSIASEQLFNNKFKIERGETFAGTDERLCQNAKITYWDELSADATGAWTVKAGARVRLTGKTKLAELTIDSAEDTIIDLNGNILSVNKLTVGGVQYPSGTYTAENLTFLMGEGKIESGRKGYTVIIR